MSKRHGNREVKKPKKKGSSGPADGPALPGSSVPASTPPVAPRNKR
jgi:hypothetical protein